jgi:hypothetical protein
MKGVAGSLAALALSFSTTALIAACSSGTTPPPGGTGSPVPMPDAGGTDAAGSTPDAAAAPDSAADGSADDGASDSAPDVAPEATDDATIDAAPDAPPAPPLCNPTATWGTGTLLAISTPDLDRFGSISADELSIAWMTPGTADGGTLSDAGGADGGTVSGVVHYADRVSTAVPFGPPQVLPAIAGYFSLGAVALSPDGLHLIIVRADLQGFGEVTRPARGTPFGTTVDQTPFSQLNLLAGNGAVDDPAMAGSGTALAISNYGFDMSFSLTLTHRPMVGSAWMGWDRRSETELRVDPTGKLRRPTGVAADERTLFFWDEVRGIERAAWRDSIPGMFTTFLDLGPRQFAQPNAACTRIYYSAPGASSVDLFYADAH